MEAEVLHTELGVEVECVVHFCQCQFHRIGIAVEGTLSGSISKRVNQALVECVPVCHAKAQPFCHCLSGNDAVWLVVPESHARFRIVGPDEGDRTV